VAEDIRTLSAALASDPSSLRYVDLAELLRRRGQAGDALRVAMHGLSRHPDHADGYDVLARIHADRNELSEARAAWERALAIDADHTGALKGIGFLLFRQGDTFRAEDALERAVAADPADESARRALQMIRGGADETAPVRRGEKDGADETAQEKRRDKDGADTAAQKTAEEIPQLRATGAVIRPPEPRPTRAVEPPPLTPEEAARAAAKGAIPDPRSPAPGPRPPVFEGFEGATNDILLLDARGLVMAGGLRGHGGGEDVAELAAAALAGVSGEASRTAGYLSLGIWNVIVAEAENANVVLSPVGDGALLMARRERSTPVGLAIRIAERARSAAARWLAEQG